MLNVSLTPNEQQGQLAYTGQDPLRSRSFLTVTEQRGEGEIRCTWVSMSRQGLWLHRRYSRRPEWCHIHRSLNQAGYSWHSRTRPRIHSTRSRCRDPTHHPLPVDRSVAREAHLARLVRGGREGFREVAGKGDGGPASVTCCVISRVLLPDPHTSES